MTNTRITDPEILETRYPLRLWRFAIRRESGGAGLHRGGDGVIREIECLSDLSISLLTSRRNQPGPYGSGGGQPGSCGLNIKIDRSGDEVTLPEAVLLQLAAGERIRIETPGGGGYGKPTGR
jgi:5-oxoprolinase (ATP-hydrolysing)